MLETKNLTKDFGELKVLKGINLTIEAGQKVVIIGPSGSGKSTLLRCLNLLETPSSGQVIFQGKVINQAGVDLNQVREKMGMVFQQFNLFSNLNIIHNLTLAPTIRKKLSQADALEKAQGLLQRIGLADKAKAFPKQLSGGQQQRIAIARALMMDPDLLLFDEPTSALDPEMVGEVLDLITELAESGMTMVVVSHEMAFAREVASRILFMDEGQILEDSFDPHKFFAEPQDKRARQFLSKIL